MVTYEDPTTWRGRTTGGIPYRLVSQRGTSRYATTTVTEEIILPASLLLSFLFESFPPPRVINGFPVYAPRRLPGMARLVTREISWEPFIGGKPIDPFNVDPTAPSGTYDENLKVTIVYDNESAEQEQDPQKPETYLEIQADSACTVLNVSAQASEWFRPHSNADEPEGTTGEYNGQLGTREPGTSPTQAVPILIPQTEWSLTWSRIDRTFWTETLKPRLDAAMGRVNAAELEFLAAPAESLLFCGYSIRDQRYPFTPEDAPELDWSDAVVDTIQLTMKLLSKDVVDEDSGETMGHNHFWRDEKGRWERLLIDGRDVYQKTDMDALFLPA